MKYKGFIIEKAFIVGADSDFNSEGILKTRRPRKDEIFYNLLDPMTASVSHDGKWTTAESIREAKNIIDALLKEIGMKSNNPKEWDKLSTKVFMLNEGEA